MKTRLLTVALAAITLPALAACGGSSSSAERLADNVEAAAENRADAMRAEAESLMNRADRTEAVGEQRADAIEAADQNVAALTPEERQAVIRNEAPAVH